MISVIQIRKLLPTESESTPSEKKFKILNTKQKKIQKNSTVLIFPNTVKILLHLFIYLFIYLFILREREHVYAQVEKEGQREGETESQAGSGLSAQSQMWGSNS